MAIKLIPIVDDCVGDEDARGRCDAANRILIELWPIMQRCFDALRDQQKQAQQNSQNQQPSGLVAVSHSRDSNSRMQEVPVRALRRRFRRSKRRFRLRCLTCL